jgi:hypothetical protein
MTATKRPAGPTSTEVQRAIRDGKILHEPSKVPSPEEVLRTMSTEELEHLLGVVQDELHIRMPNTAVVDLGTALRNWKLRNKL